MINVERKTVTPEMASVWLTKNKRNRQINPRRVTMYAKEMREGRWLDHHQGIAFYEDGSLADGQHRLAAVVESGESIAMIVARNIPNKSGLMIDGHQQRQAHQAIKISGLADWIGKDEAATTKMIAQIDQDTSSSINMTHLDLIDYAERHKEAILFAHNTITQKKRYLTTAMIKACVACAFYYEDTERLESFCRVIVSGMPESQSDRPAILLREFLFETANHSGCGAGRIEVARRSMRAIKAFCEHQDLKKLYAPKVCIYKPPALSMGNDQ